VDDSFVPKLQELSEKYRFLIFEDRKFADIGSTVREQYGAGPFRIADWAHITNAHALPGPGLVEGLMEVGLEKRRGLLLLAEMSSKGNLAGGAYTQATVQLAQKYPDFVMGFITQHRVCENPTSIHFTPGVKLQPGSEALGQQWNTPELVIKDNGADVIIVGRGIYASDDPAGMAERYQEAGWNAYLEARAQ
jgi:uridine monophosphate synthetase